jgi:hypothetical protein
MLDSVIAEGFMHNGHLQHFETVASVEGLKPHLKDLTGA